MNHVYGGGSDLTAVTSSPFLFHHGGHEQEDDAGAHQAYHHPKHDEPRRGLRGHGGCQGGIDANKLQSGIREEEGAVDTMSGLTVGQGFKRVILEETTQFNIYLLTNKNS